MNSLKGKYTSTGTSHLPCRLCWKVSLSEKKLATEIVAHDERQNPESVAEFGYEYLTGVKNGFNVFIGLDNDN
jgi:hypothetical protein